MPKKVFELAKELEIGPLDLVESLKTKGFNVRNHMAELSDDDVAKFLSALKKDKEESAMSSGDTKKKVVRKKVATTELKSVEKKSVERKVVEKKSEDVLAQGLSEGAKAAASFRSRRALRPCRSRKNTIRRPSRPKTGCQ